MRATYRMLLAAALLSAFAGEASRCAETNTGVFTVRYFVFCLTPPTERKGNIEATSKDLGRIVTGLRGATISTTTEESVAAVQRVIPDYGVDALLQGSGEVTIGKDYPTDKANSAKITVPANGPFAVELTDEFSGTIAAGTCTALQSRGRVDYRVPGSNEIRYVSWDGSFANFQLGNSYCVFGAFLPDGRVLMYELSVLKGKE